MGTNVYANNNEIASKKAKGKSTASFPDPCWSPPPPPTGPIVIPYPNTAKASSLKKGSRTVLIKGTMAAKKDISYFAKSSGDEAATKAFQKGILTRTITGKAYFIMWSQNVKFEGQGVARHNDKMTHNHGSDPANTPPNNYMDTSDAAKEACKEQLDNIKNVCDEGKANAKKNAWMGKACENLQIKPSYPTANQHTIDEWKKNGEKTLAEIEKIETRVNSLLDKQKNYLKEKIGAELAKEAINEATQPHTTVNKMTEIMSDLAKQNSCVTARRCVLRKYSSTKYPGRGKGCCPGQTGHHLIPAAMGKQCQDYQHKIAPTICAEGVSNVHGSHGALHDKLKLAMDKYAGKTIDYQTARDECIATAIATFPDSGCSKTCFEVQLDEFYKSNCKDTKFTPESGTAGNKPKTETKINQDVSLSQGEL